ncbi:MAG TPA: hypothetical protein VF744_07490 [Beijerinckiaceae bacterium]|jgi:predicted RecA/RadA family phage recombinase
MRKLKRVLGGALFLAMVCFAAERLIVGLASGVIQAPKHGGEAWWGEGAHVFFALVYVVMLLTGAHTLIRYARRYAPNRFPKRFRKRWPEGLPGRGWPSRGYDKKLNREISP